MDSVDILGPGGLIARRMPGYEERPQQLDMAVAVTGAFDDREPLLGEAGTGVGRASPICAPRSTE